MIGTIVVIKLNRLGQRRANQFCKRFYGQDTSTRGKRYRRIGLLDEMPHVKLARGVVIVSTRDAKEVIKFLRKFNAEAHVRSVILTPQDRKILRVKGV